MIKLDFLKCLPKNIEGIKHWKSTHRSKGPNSLLPKHFYKSLLWQFCGRKKNRYFLGVVFEITFVSQSTWVGRRIELDLFC